MHNLFDPDVEKSVLGSIFINPNIIKTLHLSDGDFFIDRNRWIFQAMVSVITDTGYVDMITVQDALDKNGHKNEIELSYIMDLQFSEISTVSIDSHSAILRELTVRRNAVAEAQKLANYANDRTKDINEVLGDASKRLTEITSIPSTTKHISYYIKRHSDIMDDRLNNPDTYKPIKTGMLDFDYATGGGLRRGEMMLLLGKPGLGKTIWAMQAAQQMGEYGVPGVIFEMELPEGEAMDRVVSAKSKLSVIDKLEQPSNMKTEDWETYYKAVAELDNPDIGVYFDFGIDWSTSTIKANLIRMKQEYNINWFMLDYLKFLTDDYRGEEYARKAVIAGRLKKVCKELGLAGLVIADMNKAGIGSAAPSNQNIGGTSEISFDVDKTLFMTEHIPSNGEEKNENIVTFMFDKSRRELKKWSFNMLKLKQYPAFGNITK